MIDYASGPRADYAVPVPEHFLPLLYCPGATGDDKPSVFNNVCNLGSMAMTGFAFLKADVMGRRGIYRRRWNVA